MASSSSRKSSSSASRSSKPTFRRAGKAERASVKAASAPRTTSGPSGSSAHRGRSYTVPTKKSSASAASRTKAAPRRAPKPAPRIAAAPSPSKGRTGAPTPKGPSARQGASKPTRRQRVPQGSSSVSPSPRPAKRRRASASPARPIKVVPGGKRPSSRPGGGNPVIAVVLGAGAVVAGAIRGVFGAIARLLGRFVSGRVAAIAAALVAVVLIGAIVLVNSPVFRITDVVVNGSDHVSKETVERLVEIPDGATLFNVDTGSIEEGLSQSPWISGVDIERRFPGTLVITPTERKVAAIAYITSDDVAWAVGTDGYWIAPVSLSVTVDAEGNVVSTAPMAAEAQSQDQGDAADGASADGSSPDGADAAADGTDGASDGADATGDGTDGSADGASDGSGDGAPSDDGASQDASDGADASGDGASDGEDGSSSGEGQLSGVDAARAIAKSYGAVLLTDVPADIEPSSRQQVSSDVILAGLEYANGFSQDFVKRIKEISVPSIDAITAYLDSGVEVALGEPVDITNKELIVTRLLDQQQGVTYVNVRTPDHYTFRSAPAS